MSLSCSDFLFEAIQNPALALTTALTLAVLLVNGWTDAPNAIAPAVLTGAISFRRGVLLAAICNFLGVLCVTTVRPAVARTIYTIARFSGGPGRTLCALCAGMAAIVLWAFAAWLFGIPTSESHALVAGVSGAAAALERDLGCINWNGWGKVLLGLILSTVLGLLFGHISWRLLRPISPSAGLCRLLQTPGAAITAFFHGAQDGQKFLGVFLLGVSLAAGRPEAGSLDIPVWLMLLCAAFMALGTCLGGKRIIDTLGREMDGLGPQEGVCCDAAAAVCLLPATLWGLPVSTTHTRVSALLGVGWSSGGKADWRTAGAMAAAWLLTFPCCFGMGFLLARLLLDLL